jgi:Flp pilus assembly protein TadD
MLDYKLYGLNAGGYHLTNLILHILSTLLLFWLFDRMTKEIWKSAFVAALFALHPLHVESVAWISERKDVLSAFFWMLTLCLYVYYTEKPVIRRYLLVIFSFVLALMSKPMVVTLPVIMILLDYWPLKRLESQKGNLILWQLKEKIPFFALSVIISIITIYAQHNLSKKFIPLIYRITNAPVYFVSYLQKISWPNDMAFIYPMSEQISFWHTFGALLLIIFISIFVVMTVKRLPYLFVGWLWYAITILPVLGIVNAGLYWIHDLYTYLPSIGITIIIAWGIPPLLRNEYSRKKYLFPAAIAYLVIMIFLTWQQCGYWKNSITLFNHSLQATKDSALAHYNYGLALFSEGKIEQAINQYDKAIRITPNVVVYFNRGLAYANISKYQNAIDDFTTAIHLKPDYATYYNRANAYATIGRYQNAIDDFDKALHLKPAFAEAYNNRGNIYGQHGQYKLAINDFNKVIGMNPNHIKAYNNRGLAYSELEQYQNAIKDFNTAISLKPDYANAYNNRANVYIKQNNKELGCNDARKACSLGVCATLETAKLKGYCR